MEDGRELIEGIIAAAQAKGLSQKALAARSGVPEETLSRMKKRGSGNLALVARLASAAGTRLALSGTSLRPRKEPRSFRDKYAVALAWSNPDASTDVLIRSALLKPGFQLLLDAALEFGIDRLMAQWALLKAEGSPDAVKSAPVTERLLKHLHDGSRQAAA
jgi:transcriptional regulator with XRE-family HTH domain